MPPDFDPTPHGPTQFDEGHATAHELPPANGKGSTSPEPFAARKERAFREAERATRTALMVCYNG